MLAFAGLGSVVGAYAFTPVAPGNLQAEAEGGLVRLTWDWGNAKLLSSHGFEDGVFPPAEWQVKNTFNFDDSGNWMSYTQLSTDPTVIHSGERCLLVMPALDGDYGNPSTFHQDEWLIIKPDKGAVYMDFWYYIYPVLLDYGVYPDFPDHYYVHISRDGGKTWLELWDARWDMGSVDAVQQASLFLGEPTDDDTLVAFNAVSGEEDTLYFLWSIDDVEFSSAVDGPVALSLRKTTPAKKPIVPEGATLYRKFEPQSSQKTMRAPVREWLNNGNITYRVYCDGEIVGDYIKRHDFTDYSERNPGFHNYSVLAWCEADDEEFDAAEANVEIEEATFNPARNVQAIVTPEANGRYTVEATWEAPDGDRVPVAYNVYFNGKSIGMVDETSDELRVGQSGLYRGIYNIAVEASYQYPSGVSVLAEATAVAGTVPAVEGLTMVKHDDEKTLSWRKPSGTDIPQISHYTVYRGDRLIDGNNTSMTCTDDIPVTGSALYSVHVVYADGTVSLPATILIDNEAPVPSELPLTEKFDNGHLPENWTSELVDPNDRVKDMYAWRFDNWFDTQFPDDELLEGHFASTDGFIAGMNRLENYLVTPSVTFTGDNPGIKFTKVFSDEKPGPMGAAKFILQVTSDGGQNWTDVADLTAVPNGQCTYVLPELKDKTAQFRWGFLSRNSGIAAIDNVELSDNTVNGIETAISADNNEVDVYATSGILIRKAITRADLITLPKGIYILKGSGGAEIFTR